MIQPVSTKAFYTTLSARWCRSRPSYSERSWKLSLHWRLSKLLVVSGDVAVHSVPAPKNNFKDFFSAFFHSALQKCTFLFYPYGNAFIAFVRRGWCESNVTAIVTDSTVSRILKKSQLLANCATIMKQTFHKALSATFHPSEFKLRNVWLVVRESLADLPSLWPRCVPWNMNFAMEIIKNASLANIQQHHRKNYFPLDAPFTFIMSRACSHL